MGVNVSNTSWMLVPARWSSKAFFLLSLIHHPSTKYRNFLSHFSHLWATGVGSPLALNGAIDGIPKFAAAIVIQSQYIQNKNNNSTMSLRG